MKLDSWSHATLPNLDCLAYVGFDECLFWVDRYCDCWHTSYCRINHIEAFGSCSMITLYERLNNVWTCSRAHAWSEYRLSYILLLELCHFLVCNRMTSCYQGYFL